MKVCCLYLEVLDAVGIKTLVNGDGVVSGLRHINARKAKLALSPGAPFIHILNAGHYLVPVVRNFSTHDKIINVASSYADRAVATPLVQVVDNPDPCTRISQNGNSVSGGGEFVTDVLPERSWSCRETIASSQNPQSIAVVAAKSLGKLRDPCGPDPLLFFFGISLKKSSSGIAAGQLPTMVAGHL